MNAAVAPNAVVVRLDKWLWAARFFKTRSLAKDAIEGGLVRYEGQHAKVSRAVEVGAMLTIRQGFDDIDVIVRALSDQRGGAPQARLLYEETTQSRERREHAARQRKAAGATISTQRPSKQQRRVLERFKRGLGE